jgi:hypothetical protein
VLDVPDDERRFALGLVLDRGDELGLGLIDRQPGYALELLAPVGVQLVQLSGPPVEFLPALAESLGAVLDALELLVEPLLAVGEAGFPALEVAAQLADLVLDRADLFLDLAAPLGGLLGFLARPLEDPAGLGLGPGPDVLGFGGGALQLVAVRGARLKLRRARGATPHDYEREYHREQPDHHERERQSAAHGHPFPSIALGAPLCCYRLVFGTEVYAPARAIARRIRPSTGRRTSLITQRICLLLPSCVTAPDGTTTRCREVKA